MKVRSAAFGPSMVTCTAAIAIAFASVDDPANLRDDLAVRIPIYSIDGAVVEGDVGDVAGSTTAIHNMDKDELRLLFAQIAAFADVDDPANLRHDLAGLLPINYSIGDAVVEGDGHGYWGDVAGSTKEILAVDNDEAIPGEDKIDEHLAIAVAAMSGVSGTDDDGNGPIPECEEDFAFAGADGGVDENKKADGNKTICFFRDAKAVYGLAFGLFALMMRWANLVLGARDEGLFQLGLISRASNRRIVALALCASLLVSADAQSGGISSAKVDVNFESVGDSNTSYRTAPSAGDTEQVSQLGTGLHSLEAGIHQMAKISPSTPKLGLQSYPESVLTGSNQEPEIAGRNLILTSTATFASLFRVIWERRDSFPKLFNLIVERLKSWFTANEGSYIQRISPCNTLPLASEELYYKLPIIGAVVELLQFGFESFFELLFESDTIIDDFDGSDNGECKQEDEECEYLEQCCLDGREGLATTCEKTCQFKTTQEDPFLAWEYPFCAVWSVNDSGWQPDMFAFAGFRPWPPIPWPLLSASTWLQEKMAKDGKVLSNNGCDKIVGFKLHQVPRLIGYYPVFFTGQIKGFGLSSIFKTGKMAFGTAADTKKVTIWDGFLNRQLPETSGINFWFSFRINMVGSVELTIMEHVCKSEIHLETWDYDAFLIGHGVASSIGYQRGYIGTLVVPRIVMDVEVYVGKGPRMESDGDVLARALGDNGVAEPDKDWCILIAVTRMGFSIPLLGTITFGTAIGGLCTFPPDASGIRCAPSGYFVNLDTRVGFEPSWYTGGVWNALSSILGVDPNESDIREELAQINSIGVFTNPDDENTVDAIVGRLEMPFQSLFGINLGPTPFIHLQFILNAREIYRRRQTLLRTSERCVTQESCPDSGWGPWKAICMQVGEECGDGGWAPYYPNREAKDLWDLWEKNRDDPPPFSTKYEICEDILINENGSADKLTYYNRIIAAQPIDSKEKYKITPTKGIDYTAPPKYDYSEDSGEFVFIMYGGMANWGVRFLLIVNEVSFTVIYSDGTPESRIPAPDFDKATKAYQDVDEAQREEFGLLPPDHYYFPSLEWYTGSYLTSTNGTAVLEWNAQMEINKNERLGLYGRLFCEISVLQFARIKLGLVIENYGDSESKDPSSYTLAGQFEASALGMVYSVSVTANWSQNNKDHRHLQGDEYARALQESGLMGAAFSAGAAILGCEPDTSCAVIVEFLVNACSAIWSGLTAIGTFIADGIVYLLSGAIELLGNWGAKFAEGISNIFNGVASGFKSLFGSGDSRESLRAASIDNWSQSAKRRMERLSDGRWTINDVLDIGNMILDSAKLVGTLILTGIVDVFSAIGSFFSSLISNIPYVGWDELRMKRSYESPSNCDYTACRSDIDEASMKRKCWCTDEFECRVKVAETRDCHYNIWFSTICGSWNYVPVEKNGNYPRWDSRSFDQACREARMANIAQADRDADSAKSETSFVNGNFQSKFNGLASFSPENINRRRLTGANSPIKVDDVTVETFDATKDNVPIDVSVTGRYVGTQLKSDSTNSAVVDSIINVDLEYSNYRLDESGRQPTQANGEDLMRSIQRGAAKPLLEDLVFEDSYMAEQPLIPPPEIALSSSNIGTSSAPYRLSCSQGNLDSVWGALLKSFDPESASKPKSRRLSQHFEENIVDITVKSLILERLIDRTIPITITGGSLGGDDVFLEAKVLLGTDGAGSFLDTDRIIARRLQGGRQPLSKEHLMLSLHEVSTSCAGIRWEFQLRVKGTFDNKYSNKISIFATVDYGSSSINDTTPPIELQTSCNTSPHEPNELDDDVIMRLVYGVDTFMPSLKVENCPRPFWHLQPNDVVTNVGEVCTTNYKVVTRNWALVSSREDCPVPASSEPLLTQDITFGGLINPNTQMPATPVFFLEDETYELPSGGPSSVATDVSDFYKDGEPPSEGVCGLCLDTAKAVVFSHSGERYGTFDFNDGENHEVTITVTNNIGVAVTKSATAKVNVGKFNFFGTSGLCSPAEEGVYDFVQYELSPPPSSLGEASHLCKEKCNAFPDYTLVGFTLDGDWSEGSPTCICQFADDYITSSTPGKGTCPADSLVCSATGTSSGVVARLSTYGPTGATGYCFRNTKYYGKFILFGDGYCGPAYESPEGNPYDPAGNYDSISYAHYPNYEKKALAHYHQIGEPTSLADDLSLAHGLCKEECQAYPDDKLVGFTVQLNSVDFYAISSCNCLFSDNYVTSSTRGVGTCPADAMFCTSIFTGSGSIARLQDGLLFEIPGSELLLSSTCFENMDYDYQTLTEKYTKVGNGQCLDSDGRAYGFVRFVDIKDCAMKCQSLPNLKQQVAISIGPEPGDCTCQYTDGQVPPASVGANLIHGAGNGVGAVETLASHPSMSCHRHKGYEMEYTFVGDGQCVAPNEYHYDYTVTHYSTGENCFTACRRLGNLKAQTGVSYDPKSRSKKCTCHYTNGQGPDMSADKNGLTFDGNVGAGEVMFTAEMLGLYEENLNTEDGGLQIACAKYNGFVPELWEKECTMARFEGTFSYGDGGVCSKTFHVNIKCTSDAQCVFQERSLDGEAHWESCGSFDPSIHLDDAFGRCSLGAQNGIALREKGTSGCVAKYHFFAIAKDASGDASANALDIHFSNDGGQTFYTEDPGDSPRDAQPDDSLSWARRVQACESNEEEVGRFSNKEEGGKKGKLKRGKAKTSKKGKAKTSKKSKAKSSKNGKGIFA